MKSIVEYCKDTVPKDMKHDLFPLKMDWCLNNGLIDWMLEQVIVSPDEVKSMTIEDLQKFKDNSRYWVILLHIFCLGIDNISAGDIKKHLELLLSTNNFEPDVFAYVWLKSNLNDYDTYPSHSTLINVGLSSTDRDLLKWLWDVANTNDVFLCEVLYEMSCAVDSVYFVKLLSYCYLCKNIRLHVIETFVKDMDEVKDMKYKDIIDTFLCCDNLNDTIKLCLRKGYTMSEYLKHCHVKKLPVKPFNVTVDRLPRKVLPIRIKGTGLLEDVPVIPNGYKPLVDLWR